MSAAPSIAVALSVDAHKSRRPAYRKYTNLLAELLSATRAAHPGMPPTRSVRPDPASADPKLLAQLRAAAAALGRTPADVETDAQLVAKLQSTRARVAAGRDLEAAIRDAGASVHAHDAETARIVADRAREYRRLYEAYRVLSERQVAGQQAAREVDKLLAQHPDLLSALDAEEEKT